MTDETLTDEERQEKLDNSIQVFAKEIGIICALEAGGKIDPKEAYFRIKSRWRTVKASKRELFPKQDNDDQAI